MADDDKRKFEAIPWATILPILAALAGLVAQYKPLVSTRPTVPSEKPVPVIAKQDVDARLWQDPIGVAQKQKLVLDAQLGGAGGATRPAGTGSRGGGWPSRVSGLPTGSDTTAPTVGGSRSNSGADPQP